MSDIKDEVQTVKISENGNVVRLGGFGVFALFMFLSSLIVSVGTVVDKLEAQTEEMHAQTVLLQQIADHQKP